MEASEAFSQAFITALTDMERRVMDLSLNDTPVTISEIARQVGSTPDTVYQIKRDLARRYYTEIRRSD